MSKLLFIRKILEGRRDIQIVEARQINSTELVDARTNEDRNYNGGMYCQLGFSFVVAPNGNGIYNVESLNEFMYGLIPDVVPSGIIEFSENHDLNYLTFFGRIRYDEEIGKEATTRSQQIEDRGLAALLRKDDDEKVNALGLRTFVRLFPNIFIAEEFLERARAKQHYCGTWDAPGLDSRHWAGYEAS